VNARSFLALFVWLLLATLGCARETDGALWVDPGTVRFTPQHTRATVAIHNPNLLGRPVRDFRLSGPDWDALRIVDEELPRTLNGHDVAIVTIEVSPAAFASGPDPEHRTYREGHATLEFESERQHYEVPLVFSPQAQPRGSGVLAIVVALLLSLAAGGLALVRAGPAEPRSRAGVLGLSLAFTGLFASAALLPLGPGWCSGRLGEMVGAVELAQCRAGLGGRAPTGWVADPDLAWLFVALAAATLGVVLHLGVSNRRPRAVPIVARLFGFGLVSAALVASLGASELDGLVLAQQRTFAVGPLNLPRWGVVMQPIAFVLALLMIADAGPRSSEPSPTTTMLARLDDLVWSALVVALFLGAGSVPGLTDSTIPRLLHGTAIAVELLAFVGKTAVIVLVVRRLRMRPRRPHAREGAEYRTIATLALINLLATVAWLIVGRFFV
jgi:hypothetical protein